MDATVEETKKPLSARFKWARLKKPGKNLFWAWIAYQCVKGTITTTFIWVPLLYAWLHHS